MICMVLVVLSGKMLYEGEHGVMTVVEISSKELLFQLEYLDKKEEEEKDEREGVALLGSLEETSTDLNLHSSGLLTSK